MLVTQEEFPGKKWNDRDHEVLVTQTMNAHAERKMNLRYDM